MYMATLTVVFRPSRAGTAVWQRWRKAFVHTQATPCEHAAQAQTRAADENVACIGGATALSRVDRIELIDEAH